MKKYHILYGWPAAEITRLTDSTVAETFASGLGAAELTLFTTVAEKIRTLGAEIGIARANRVHFAKWSELRQLIEEFEQHFSLFPDFSGAKFRVWLLLADKLTQTAAPLDEMDIDETTFEIRDLPEFLPIHWFSHENTRTPSDSIAVFSCQDLAALESELSPSNITPEFIFHFLSVFQELLSAPAGSAVLAKRSSPQINISAIDAFARLVMLSTGKKVHTPHRYSLLPIIIDANGIQAGEEYQQWNDVLNVLSEYNSRDEILMKYLTIYHVIENFMFKLPIVELEQRHAGRMFSIRDFKQMYKRVDITENKALQDLFKQVFLLPATASLTFNQHVTNRWISLVPPLTPADIDRVLLALGVPFTFSQFQGPEAGVKFAQVVYAIRNAIAHNKETELHLTYAFLERDPTTTAVIESFLIPSLEEISFALISTRNQLLWYSNPTLALY